MNEVVQKLTTKIELRKVPKIDFFKRQPPILNIFKNFASKLKVNMIEDVQCENL